MTWNISICIWTILTIYLCIISYDKRIPYNLWIKEYIAWRNYILDTELERKLNDISGLKLYIDVYFYLLRILCVLFFSVNNLSNTGVEEEQQNNIVHKFSILSHKSTNTKELLQIICMFYWHFVLLCLYWLSDFYVLKLLWLLYEMIATIDKEKLVLFCFSIIRYLNINVVLVTQRK